MIGSFKISMFVNSTYLYHVNVIDECLVTLLWGGGTGKRFPRRTVPRMEKFKGFLIIFIS